MGVPAFYKWITKNSNVTEKNVKNIDVLMIDFNSLIHPVASSIPNCTDTTKIKAVVSEIDKLIKITRPREVFIASDGVPPMAKIKRQKIRKYGAVITKNIEKKIYRKYGTRFPSSEWDNVVISPGTSFMYNLMIEINKYIDSLKNIDIIFSSYQNIGEGEHKIMEFIRDYYQNKTVVIYGMDADLIFLSLINSKYARIYIMREEMEFDKNANQEGYLYLNINKFKKTINSMFIEEIGEDALGIDFIDDFTIISMFIGNDFLPQVISMDINSNVYRRILRSYADHYKKYRKPLYHDGNLSKLLYYILRDLSLQQNNNLPRNFYRKIPPEILEQGQPYIDIYKFNNMIGNFKEIDVNTYNHKYFNGNVEDACKEYFHGLLWNIDYYYGKNPTFTWQYKYMRAPLLTDMIKYLEKDLNVFKYKIPKFDKDNVSIPTQLFITFHPTQFRYIELDMNIEYPYTDYKLDCEGHGILWKCDIDIPPLEYKSIEKKVKALGKLPKLMQINDTYFTNIQ